MDLKDKLKSLAADLELISSGEGPSPNDLIESPILVDWELIELPVTAIAGYAIGHPKLGSGHVTTTQIFAIAHDRTWVRTLSRYYRLGQPLR